MFGQQIRLNKLINPYKNCVIVALDAGGFLGPYPGLMDLNETCQKLNEADAIVLEPGAIEICKNTFLGENPPLLVTRLNWNTDYCFQWKYNKSQIVKTLSPQSALALGADIGIASLSINTKDESVDSKNIENFTKIIEDAKKIGFPIIGEIYPPDKGYDSNEFHELIYISCRIAAELGANAIKTFYTGDKFKEIVDSVFIPVLALGGDKRKKDICSLKQAEESIKAGARGVVFGRNLYQANNPERFLEALKAIVNGKISAENAVDKYNLSK